MIDIHTHILPIDDGSESIEVSLKMLKSLRLEGVTDVILTPHYRGKYRFTVDELKEKFNGFCDVVRKENIDINLYLGEEIFYLNDFASSVESGFTLSLADSKFILMEYPYRDFVDIEENSYSVMISGCKPVIAHIERYEYATVGLVEDIKRLGGYIQVNASSVMGMCTKFSKRFTRKLLRKRLIDFVASDIHDGRKTYLTESYNFVAKKCGKEYADAIFNENAKMIIGK